MSISTYSELQSGIGNWLNRSDLSLRIPEFIALAESRLNRVLRTRDQHKRSTATLDSQYTQLPIDFLESRNIQISTTPPKRLIYVTPDRADDLRQQHGTTTGEPKYFSILGKNLETIPTSDSSSRTVEIAYFSKIPALSDSQTTNWVLTDHPDIYMFGSLVHAEPFLMNDARLTTWQSLLDNALRELQQSDERSKITGGTLVSRPISSYS